MDSDLAHTFPSPDYIALRRIKLSGKLNRGRLGKIAKGKGRKRDSRNNILKLLLLKVLLGYIMENEIAMPVLSL